MNRKKRPSPIQREVLQVLADGGQLVNDLVYAWEGVSLFNRAGRLVSAGPGRHLTVLTVEALVDRAWIEVTKTDRGTFRCDEIRYYRITDKGRVALNVI